LRWFYNDQTDEKIRLTFEPAGPDKVLTTGERYPVELIEIEGRKQHNESLTTFFNCIENGAESPATLRDARHSLAVACAFDYSAQKGKLVKVPGLGESL
jgi:predicted dehydrogenase